MQNQKLLSILYMVAGGVLVLFPYSSIKWIMMVLGALFLIYGISCVNASLRSRTTEGIVLMVLGLLLIIGPQFVLNLLPVILGALILAYGIREIQQAWQKKQLGGSRWGVDLAIAIAITLLGASLIANPSSLVKLLVKLVGVLIIYEGAAPLLRQNNRF